MKSTFVSFVAEKKLQKFSFLFTIFFPPVEVKYLICKTAVDCQFDFVASFLALWILPKSKQNHKDK
jgi:hypothetical protein